ncbi:MAG: response regulator, partial [Candidatus Kapaibacterium sp.]
MFQVTKPFPSSKGNNTIRSYPNGPSAGGGMSSTDGDTYDNVFSDGPEAPILIVDDEPFVADLIHHWVQNVWDYPSIIAHSGEEAIIQMRERHPRLVLLDINLPDINGIDVLRAIKSADEHLPVVMISAQESVATAVEALKAGAYDYLTKPIDTERLQVIIRNAIMAYGFHQKLRHLQQEINSRYDFSNIISADPKMHDLFKL